MLERLFVYGTLAPGKPNAHVVGAVAGHWQKAWINGHLLKKGWGSEQGYPGILVDAAGEPVEGYVLTSESLGSEWTRLDDFEGIEYERVIAPVRLEDGHVVEAFVYQVRITPAEH